MPDCRGCSIPHKSSRLFFSSVNTLVAPTSNKNAGYDGGHEAGRWIAHSCQNCLDRLRAIGSYQSLQLRNDFALGRFSAEEVTGNRDGKDEDGRHREQGVEGQGSAFARPPVIDPGLHRIGQDSVNTPQVGQ